MSNTETTDEFVTLLPSENSYPVKSVEFTLVLKEDAETEAIIVQSVKLIACLPSVTSTTPAPTTTPFGKLL